MKRNLQKKIVLARETLLALTQPDLRGAAGGQGTGHATCAPGYTCVVGYTCPECAQP